MKTKIKKVTSINNQGTKSFTVGVNGVVEIKDNTIEFENSVNFIYDAYDKNGKVVGTFINGSLAIDYI